MRPEVAAAVPLRSMFCFTGTNTIADLPDLLHRLFDLDFTVLAGGSVVWAAEPDAAICKVYTDLIGMKPYPDIRTQDLCPHYDYHILVWTSLVPLSAKTASNAASTTHPPTNCSARW